MDKNFWGALVGGVLGGFVASVLILPFLIRNNFLGTAVILDKIVKPKEIVTKVEEKSVIVAQADYFADAVAKVRNSVVAIESFSQNRLIRTGSGIVMTRDGLVFTVNSVVPEEATLIQVINGGKITPAQVAYRSRLSNLAIILIPENDLEVVRLEDNLPEIAQKVLTLSKLIEFGNDRVLINDALVSQVTEEKGIFKISAQYDQNLFGSALIDNQGNVIGLLDFKNFKPSVIGVKGINGDLNTYLSRIK